MSIERWEDVVDRDFPHPSKVSRRMVEAAARQGMRYGCGGARFCTGRFSTTEELEARMQEARKPFSYRNY